MRSEHAHEYGNTRRVLRRYPWQVEGWRGGRDYSVAKQLGYSVRAEWAVLTCIGGSLYPPSWWGGCSGCNEGWWGG